MTRKSSAGVSVAVIAGAAVAAASAIEQASDIAGALDKPDASPVDTESVAHKIAERVLDLIAPLLPEKTVQTIDKVIDTAELMGQAMTGLSDSSMSNKVRWWLEQGEAVLNRFLAGASDEDAHRIGNAFVALTEAFEAHPATEPLPVAEPVGTS